MNARLLALVLGTTLFGCTDDGVSHQQTFDLTRAEDRALFTPSGMSFQGVVGPYAVYRVTSSEPRLLGPRVAADSGSPGIIASRSYFTDRLDAQQIQMQLRSGRRLLVETMQDPAQDGDCTDGQSPTGSGDGGASGGEIGSNGGATGGATGGSTGNADMANNWGSPCVPQSSTSTSGDNGGNNGGSSGYGGSNGSSGGSNGSSGGSNGSSGYGGSSGSSGGSNGYGGSSGSNGYGGGSTGGSTGSSGGYGNGGGLPGGGWNNTGCNMDMSVAARPDAGASAAPDAGEPWDGGSYSWDGGTITTDSLHLDVVRAPVGATILLGKFMVSGAFLRAAETLPPVCCDGTDCSTMDTTPAPSSGGPIPVQ